MMVIMIRLIAIISNFYCAAYVQYRRHHPLTVYQPKQSLQGRPVRVWYDA